MTVYKHGLALTDQGAILTRPKTSSAIAGSFKSGGKAVDEAGYQYISILDPGVLAPTTDPIIGGSRLTTDGAIYCTMDAPSSAMFFGGRAYRRSDGAMHVAAGTPGTSDFYLGGIGHNSAGAVYLGGVGFAANLADSGAGAVNTSPAFGTGSATFTRAAATATTILSTGLVSAVIGANIARSYYDPTSLAYLGYLAEGARTNLCLQSADQTSVSWVKTALTVSTLVASPDGTSNANKCVPTAVLSVHNTAQAFVKAASALAYAVTIWGKADGYNFLGVRADDNAGNGAFACFNVSTGAVSTAATGIGVAFTALATKITAFPSGWYRVELDFTSNIAAALNIICGAQNATGDPAVVSFTGDATSAVDMFGADLEQASFASSYIPTTTVAVTRNADVLTYPSAGNVIGTVGSAYAEVALQGITTTAIRGFVGLGTGIALYNNGAADGNLQSYDVTSVVAFNQGTFTGAPLKVGSSWGVSRFLYNSGVSSGVKAFDGDMNVTALEIGFAVGAPPMFGTIRNVRIFTTQVSEAQLVSMTT